MTCSVSWRRKPDHSGRSAPPVPHSLPSLPEDIVPVVSAVPWPDRIDASSGHRVRLHGERHGEAAGTVVVGQQDETRHRFWNSNLWDAIIAECGPDRDDGEMG